MTLGGIKNTPKSLPPPPASLNLHRLSFQHHPDIIPELPRRGCGFPLIKRRPKLSQRHADTTVVPERLGELRAPEQGRHAGEGAGGGGADAPWP
jgi:hypothetical protein